MEAVHSLPRYHLRLRCPVEPRDYRRSNRLESRGEYILNGVPYFMDTLCVACGEDLGEHSGSYCKSRNSQFIPMQNLPDYVLLPKGV